MQTNAHISNILATLPDHPGVYIMRDAQGEIIYVGKAISLKNRVRQYFHSQKTHSAKVVAMVQKIADISYILTDNEVEALILECNLIKEHRPHYNILMKDDKQYPYMKVDRKDPFPRVEIARRVKNDGARYFGPFIGSNALTDVLDAVAHNFPLRTCKKDILKAQQRRERPCLNYQIGKCSAPCAGKISREAYGELVDQVCAFLRGDYDALVQTLRQRMMQASDAMEYEQAALWRDRLQAVERVIQRQKAAYASEDERDVLGLARLDGDCMVFVFQMREGKLLGSDHHFMEDAAAETDADIFSAFLKQYYANSPIPAEVVLPDLPEDGEVIAQWLSARKEKKVKLLVPQRGEKRKLLHLACENAAEALEKRRQRIQRDWDRHQGALVELQQVLGLSEPPKRLECFDISHTQGVDNVASMVVFVDGRAARKEYRRFRIKTVEGADDFKSMAEVVERRLLRAMEPDEKSQTGFGQMPDLMIIDGGRGQLNAALASMERVGFAIPAMGLAERLEEIYVPWQKETILLDRKSPALHVLQSIRDEAHRFAITYHRSLRASRSLASELDAVAGIGKTRKKALLTEFKTMEQIQAATVEELLAVAGMNRKAAEAVRNHFQEEHHATLQRNES